MVKVGFIGFGNFARLRLNFVRESEDAAVIGFFDSHISGPVEGVKQYPSADSLLANIDAVIISVPPLYAPDYCLAAARFGVHAFCEKPPATSLESLMKLNGKFSDLCLAYGFNHRVHESMEQVFAAVASGSLGRILWMRGRYGKEVGESYTDDWRSNYSLNGGGILIDQGIHLLDLMDQLAGGFESCQALMSNTYLGIENVEDNAFLSLSSSTSQITASLHSTITQWRYLFSLEIFLSKGSITLNGLRTRSGSYGEERLTIKPERGGSYKGSPSDVDFTFDNNVSWEREVNAFISSCKHGLHYPYAGFSDAVRIMQLLETVYKNAVWVTGK